MVRQCAALYARASAHGRGRRLRPHQDVREGMAAFRIAAHAADIAKGIRGAALRDFMMSAARFDFRWDDQFALTFDPERAAAFHDKTIGGNGGRQAHFCSMCGPGFCPMKLARDWFQ